MIWTGTWNDGEMVAFFVLRPELRAWYQAGTTALGNQEERGESPPCSVRDQLLWRRYGVSSNRFMLWRFGAQLVDPRLRKDWTTRAVTSSMLLDVGGFIIWQHLWAVGGAGVLWEEVDTRGVPLKAVLPLAPSFCPLLFLVAQPHSATPSSILFCLTMWPRASWPRTAPPKPWAQMILFFS